VATHYRRDHQSCLYDDDESTLHKPCRSPLPVRTGARAIIGEPDGPRAANRPGAPTARTTMRHIDRSHHTDRAYCCLMCRRATACRHRARSARHPVTCASYCAVLTPTPITHTHTHTHTHVRAPAMRRGPISSPRCSGRARRIAAALPSRSLPTDDTLGATGDIGGGKPSCEIARVSHHNTHTSHAPP
jgi:hypothetical protein